MFINNPSASWLPRVRPFRMQQGSIRNKSNDNFTPKSTPSYLQFFSNSLMDFPTGSPTTPKRKKVIDRFIPHREGINLENAFGVANSVRLPANVGDLGGEPTDSKVKENRDARSMYSSLLKSEMFGNRTQKHTNPIGMHSSASTGNIPASASTGDISAMMSPDRSSGSLSNPSQNSLSAISPSHSNLSLPTSPRKRKDQQPSNSNMFQYSPKKLIRSESDLSDISMGGGGLDNLRPESRDFLLQPKPRQRRIPQTATRVLDAPKLVDDFYLNLMDWGSANRLAVGLGHHVYVYNPDTGIVNEVANLGNDTVASVSWMNSGEHVAVGTMQGKVQIYDTITSQRLRTMSGHDDRASSLAWNDHLLSSGSRDTTILHRDCRIKDHFIARLEGHRGEVCGLKWNKDLQQLASGSNDNKLKIWSGVNSSTSQDPLYEFDEHTSAVKGLAWSPHQRGLLASGGGFCDRKIWFWNTINGKSVSSIETGSQVCNLAWNPRSKELISTHGNYLNDIVVWKYPTMQPITRLRGHGFRVLYMAVSPDGSSLATGSGDETLRLWSLYDEDYQEQDDSVVDLYRQLR